MPVAAAAAARAKAAADRTLAAALAAAVRRRRHGARDVRPQLPVARGGRARVRRQPRQLVLRLWRRGAVVRRGAPRPHHAV